MGWTWNANPSTRFSTALADAAEAWAEAIDEAARTASSS
jgi:hypothetical protein